MNAIQVSRTGDEALLPGMPPGRTRPPAGEPRAFRHEATQRASALRRKDARPLAVCNAPHARVLRGFFPAFLRLCGRHTGMTDAPVIVIPV